MMPATPLEQLLAGATAGSLTAFSMSPLDVMRTHMQVARTLAPAAAAATFPSAAITAAAATGSSVRTLFTAAAGPAGTMGRAPSARAVLQNIWQTEGVRGFYHGYSCAALAIPAYWAIYFPVYNMAKRSLACDSSPSASLCLAASAICAAVVADSVTAPLWVVRTRLQTQALHRRAVAEAARPPVQGAWGIVTSIKQREGLRALYKGVTASWLGSLHVAVQFPLYEWLRDTALPSLGGPFVAGGYAGWTAPRPLAALAVATSELLVASDLLDPFTPALLPAGDAFGAAAAPHVSWQRAYSLHTQAQCAAAAASRAGRGEDVRALDACECDNVDRAVLGSTGAPSAVALVIASTLSKFVATLLTYPHETIRARLQDQRDYESRRYRGVLDCAVQTWRGEGIRGLYAGVSINLMRALPAAAVTFFAYESSLSALLHAREVATHADAIR